MRKCFSRMAEGRLLYTEEHASVRQPLAIYSCADLTNVAQDRSRAGSSLTLSRCNVVDSTCSSASSVDVGPVYPRHWELRSTRSASLSSQSMMTPRSIIEFGSLTRDTCSLSYELRECDVAGLLDVQSAMVAGEVAIEATWAS